MKKVNIVQKNDDFSIIIQQGICVKDRNLVIYSKNNNRNQTRFGISVGTKIGKAHIRNKLKRQIRNIVDNDKNSYSKSKDYIIIVRKNCLEISYEEIAQSYHKLIMKSNSQEGRFYESNKKSQ